MRQNSAITQGNLVTLSILINVGRIQKYSAKNTLGFENPGYTLGYPE